MFVVPAFLIVIFIGTFEARQPDIDFNRVKLIASRLNHTSDKIAYNRLGINSRSISSGNDYDHNSQFAELRAPLHFKHYSTPSTKAKAIEIHKPRKDPRYYYQSNEYIKEIDRKNINYEVTAIYPGDNVIKADDEFSKLMPIRAKYQSLNDIDDDDICVKCPHDRTLIAQAGVDRVILQYPQLLTCSGNRAPRDVRFIHMFGPTFGSLVSKGSHMIIGQIMYNSKTLQTCKLQIHVLIQTCPLPKYLVSHCNLRNKLCTFTCLNKHDELFGKSFLTCGDDMQWNGKLPICKARNWCPRPEPLKYGHISCQSNTFGNVAEFGEGSRCRIRCPKGWRSTRAKAICRHGHWSHQLDCQRKS